MSINLKTKIVTITPYSVLPTDEVILVNVAGPASIVLPSNGNATGEDCCGNSIHKHDDNGNIIEVPVVPEPEKPDPDPIVPVTLHRSYYIKDFSGLSQTHPITITSDGGKTIDGVKFAIINAGYEHIQVVYDGTNWKIIS
jgi:hypothetical protein